VLFAGALGALLVPTAALAQDDIQRSIRESQERLEEIRSERTSLQGEMTDLAGQVHTISEEIDNLERRIGASASVVAELDVQIDAVRSAVGLTTQDMLLTIDGLTFRRAELQERLRSIYKRGPLNTFRVLMAARSFADLINRYKYLHLIALYDRTLVSQVSELAGKLAEQRTQLATDLDHLNRLRNEKVLEMGRLESLEGERERKLVGFRSRESEAASQLAQLERDEQRLRNLVAELERARREAERTAGVATTPSITTADLGNLNWPVEGRIVYNFGPERQGATTISREGVGIAAPRGTPVRVVERGQVDYAGPVGLWGPSVIVSHGGGYFSLYLYLESLTVREGDVVEAGHLIGYVGALRSADQSEPHMEFQIREPNPSDQPIAVDPVRWLRRRS
jgi:septal ring factor EnvC (AmiA/AmiB activator)